MVDQKTILIVDDEEAITTAVSKDLIGNGYYVETAGNADEAIAKVKNRPFDLVFLDIKMPGKDGFEVLKFIKKHSPGIKVVMLTAFADLANAIESKRLGAEGFISKPYDLVDLMTSIENILSE
jgi:DNA-binding NtrC family response regulator